MTGTIKGPPITVAHGEIERSRAETGASIWQEHLNVPGVWTTLTAGSKGCLMYSEHPRPTLRTIGHPIHAMLAPVPIVCFIGTLCTDIAYWQTAEMSWANFSAWLLAVGLLFGALAWLVGLIDIIINPVLRIARPAWTHVIGSLIVLIVSFFNALVHTRDAWTSVVPTGLTLSAVVVVLILATGWLGDAKVYGYSAGEKQ